MEPPERGAPREVPRKRWYALGGSSRAVRHRLGFALIGGSMVGGIAFIAGFFGPLLLWPSSNQGPLLGIFVTGPLGFVIGCIGGALIAGGRARSNELPRLTT